MVTLVNNFEEGTNGVTITTGNSAGTGQNAFDAVTAAGTFEFSNTNVMHGNMACEISTSSSSCFGAWGTQLGASQTIVYFRTYLYFTALPTGANPRVVTLFETTSESTLVEAFDLGTTGKFHAENSGNVGAYTLSANTWYRIEGYVNEVSGESQLNYYLGDSLVALGTDNFPFAYTTMGSICYGPVGGSATWTAWIDDIGASTAGFLGPSVFPAQPTALNEPGPALLNQFPQKRHEKQSVLYDYQLTFSGNYLTAGDLAFGVNSSGVQVFMAPSPLNAQPGPAWQNVNVFGPFPGAMKRAVLFDKANIFNAGIYNNPGGDLTFGATSSGYVQALAGDLVTVAPGPAWQNQFGHLTKQPVLFDYAKAYGSNTTANMAFGATSSGIVTIAGVNPDPPRALPGQAWKNVFQSQLTKSKQIVFHDGITYPAPFGPFCLAGTELDTNLFGGSETDTNLYGGTATDANLLGGTQYSGCILQAVNITLGEFNDETIDLAITNNGNPFNLTGYGLQVLFKTAAGIQDTDPSTLILSTATTGVTITNNAGGLATLVIPNTDLDNTNFSFWRVDVTIAGTQATAMYGNVTIRSL